MSYFKQERRLNNSVAPYVPGDLTEPKYRPESHSNLANYRYEKDKYRDDAAELKGFPKTREDFSRKIKKEEDSKTVTEEICRKNKEMMEEEYVPCSCKEMQKRKLPSAVVSAIKNFDMAKKLHKLNLEHRPLPDTIADALYRKYQMENKEPGLALKEGNYASGVAWKAYPGFGPTRCTKLRVFRPKTSITNKIKDSVNDRPSSVSSFDKKWRFIRQKKVSPMQLAVCWDLTPINPTDEPKRTPHIDGSNGSLAPAVFSLVHSPKPEPEIDLEDDVEPSTVSSASIKTSKTKEFHRIRSAYDYYQNLPKEDEVVNCRKACSLDCSKHSHKKRETNPRVCVACEMKNINLKDSNKPKSDFKLAFKAGVPQKVSKTFINCRNNNYKPPKMKDPYKKRNYAIDSLAPPFSLQNYKRLDYPEHWRLASVYQHSYKPIQYRKRPLLQTVFK